MRSIHAGAEEIGVQGGPWALFVYKREFGTDWYVDYDESLVETEDGGGVFSPLFLIKTWYAMAKNADEALPPFEPWARSLDISMSVNAPWAGEVVSAIFAELFRETEEDQGNG